MEIGTVKLVDIDREMRAAYLDYAMSVITARALPDVRDGLKPVQRRILYAMNEIGLSHSSAYKKSARIVGEVLGKYHPHGDAPVYETMVRMAQDFSMRYMLVDGQGNFGSVDGDPPAAMRYTEARLAAIAEELLADLDKNTVDFVDNFDATLKEPSVLPARLPNLLINGASGIAVGMATNIPPHNLGEVADAIVFILDQFQRAVDAGIPFEMAQARVHGRPLEKDVVPGLRKHLSPEFKDLLAQEYQSKVAALDKPPRTKEQKDELEYDAFLDVVDQIVDVPVERLAQFVLGPDFPTGGIIIGRKGITDAFTTGHGRIVIRAKAFIEDRSGDRSTIIITELPYQINKATLVERIADLIRDKRIEGVSELRDESDRQGMRVVIELRRDVQARQILNNLFKLTAMQSAFSVNLLALVDGEPRVLNLKRLMQHYIDYRYQVITRRIQFDLDKARARAHILEGLKIALDNLDEVISTIRNSPDAEVARTRLIKKFKLSELQAQAILDMQLRRLAALERKKIEQELAEVLKLIGQLEDLLAHPIKVYGLIKQDLVELKGKYGDERRTKIREEEAEDFTAEDLIADEDVVVAVSLRNYFKRVPADQFRAQPRRSPARAVTAVVAKEQDPAVLLVSANTHDTIVFVSNVGKGYALKCHEIPAGDRQARGVPLSNFLSTAMAEERIAGMAALREQNGSSITLVTRQGEIKRVLAADLAGTRASGLNVMSMEPKDEVVWAGATDPGQEIIIVTARGQSIRFEPETEARSSGRGSGGVRAIRLADDDAVVAVDLVDKDGSLMVVTRLGYGKCTELADYSPQGRGGGGVMTANVTDKYGLLIAARVIAAGDDVMIVSAQGQVVRKPFEEINALPRANRGVRLVELEAADSPVAILRLRPDKKSSAQPLLPESAPPARPRKSAPADGSEAKSEPKSGPNTAEKRAVRSAATAPHGAKAAKPAGPAGAEKKAPAAPAPSRQKEKGEAKAKGKTKGAEPATDKRAARPAAAAKGKVAGVPAHAAPAAPSAEAQTAVTDEPSKTPPPSPVRMRKQAEEKAHAAAPAMPAAEKKQAPVAPSSPRPTVSKKDADKKKVTVIPPSARPTASKTAAQKTSAPADAATGEKHVKRRLLPPEPTTAAKQPPKRRGKDDIVIRAGGKTTVVPRSELLPGEAEPRRAEHSEPQPHKHEKRKTEKQIPLPLWGNEPPKKK